MHYDYLILVVLVVVVLVTTMVTRLDLPSAIGVSQQSVGVGGEVFPQTGLPRRPNREGSRGRLVYSARVTARLLGSEPGVSQALLAETVVLVAGLQLQPQLQEVECLNLRRRRQKEVLVAVARNPAVS